MERVRKREIDSASERDRECRARCAEQRGKAKRAGRLEGGGGRLRAGCDSAALAHGETDYSLSAAVRRVT